MAQHQHQHLHPLDDHRHDDHHNPPSHQNHNHNHNHHGTHDDYDDNDDESPSSLYDLLGVLKGALYSVFQPTTTSTNNNNNNTSTTTTTTTTTTTSSSSSSSSASNSPAPLFLSPPTPFTAIDLSVNHASNNSNNRSCVDFLRRLLGAPGVTDIRINALPVHKVRPGKTLAYGQDTCAICLDDYAHDSCVRVLDCKHVFHRRCIDPWLKRGRPTCPLCQTVCC